MNSLEILHALKANKFTHKIFDNVYPCDKLPKIKKNSSTKIIIANFSDSTSEGTHWVAFRISRGSLELFDSSAQSLYFNSYFQRFIRQNQRRVTLYNTLPLQSEKSDLCGEFCVLYSYYRCRRTSFSNFIKMFNHTDLRLNDKKALYLFSEHFLIPSL